MSIRFLKGEKKYVQFLISSKKKEPIIITDASFVLTRNEETVLSGACEVDGSTILVLLDPMAIGSYELEITYTIAPETRKARCLIDVY